MLFKNFQTPSFKQLPSYLKKLCYNLYAAGVKVVEHDGIEHSGYMSFMFLLSLFPFLIFFLAFTSFFESSLIGQKFINILLDNMPPNTTEIIHERVKELVISPPQRLLTLAIFGTIWTSSSFVECLRTILNRVYEVATPPAYIWRRLLSVLQFFIISVVLYLVILLLVIIPTVIAKIPVFSDTINNYYLLLNGFRHSLLFLSLFLSSAFLYYIIPNLQISFLDVIPGAILSSVLWIVNGHLLSKYIVYYNQLSIVYGSLGSIIVTLIFFYIVNLIFVYGAEFNYAVMKKDA